MTHRYNNKYNDCPVNMLVQFHGPFLKYAKKVYQFSIMTALSLIRKSNKVRQFLLQLSKGCSIYQFNLPVA